MNNNNASKTIIHGDNAELNVRVVCCEPHMYLHILVVCTHACFYSMTAITPNVDR